LAVGLLVIIILLAYHTTARSVEMKNIIDNFKDDKFSKYTFVVAFYGDNFNFENFSIFVVFAAIFQPVFKIANNQINNYLF
jgi:hypothetical protein